MDYGTNKPEYFQTQKYVRYPVGQIGYLIGFQIISQYYPIEKGFHCGNPYLISIHKRPHQLFATRPLRQTQKAKIQTAI